MNVTPPTYVASSIHYSLFNEFKNKTDIFNAIKQVQLSRRSESAELTSSVLKENVSELKLEITAFQTDLSVKKKVSDTNFWNLCYLQSVKL
jgi:hypothetical protein